MLCGELEAQGLHNGQRRFERRISILAERLIEVFASKAGFATCQKSRMI